MCLFPVYISSCLAGKERWQTLMAGHPKLSFESVRSFIPPLLLFSDNSTTCASSQSPFSYDITASSLRSWYLFSHSNPLISALSLSVTPVCHVQLPHMHPCVWRFPTGPWVSLVLTKQPPHPPLTFHGFSYPQSAKGQKQMTLPMSGQKVTSSLRPVSSTSPRLIHGHFVIPHPHTKKDGAAQYDVLRETMLTERCSNALLWLFYFIISHCCYSFPVPDIELSLYHRCACIEIIVSVGSSVIQGSQFQASPGGLGLYLQWVRWGNIISLWSHSLILHTDHYSSLIFTS